MASLIVLMSVFCFSQQAPTKTTAKIVLSGAIAKDAEVIVPVSDSDRSQKFYEALGCKLVSAKPGCVLLTGGGLSIHLVALRGVVHSNCPILVWRLRSINEDLYKGLEPLGFKLEDVRTLPDGVAVFQAFRAPCKGHVMKDPDGNILAFVEEPD
jgi:catechol 2,3-dioxygenase-like lactoylglutathione lyase family enzyme